MVFEVNIGDIKLESYEKILSRFSDWKKYKREININQLLEEGKKIQFDIEIINNTMAFHVSVKNSEYKYTTSLTINKLTFIILDNKVLKLEAELNLLDTQLGNIIKNLVESGLELKLNQHINIQGQIDNFYFNEISKNNNQ